MNRLLKIALILLMPMFALAQPEVTVKGNNLIISNGDITPSDSDGTDYAVIRAGLDTTFRTFWIVNTGTSNLTIGTIDIRAQIGTVTVFDDEYTITQPTSSVISAGDSVSFTVRYAPATDGWHGRNDNAGTGAAYVRIPSDDPGGNYDFNIHGVAIDGEPFACSQGKMILAHNTTTNFYDVDYQDMPTAFNHLGSRGGLWLDAIGINPSDSLVYGVRQQNGNRNQLWVSGDDGDSEYVGDVDGLTTNMIAFASGDFAADGYLYAVQSGLLDSMYRIDVRNLNSTVISLSETIFISDMSYSTPDGLFYAVSNPGGTTTGLISIDPATGTVTNLGNNGATGYEATFADPNGRIYGLATDGVMYLYDKSDGSQQAISSDPGFAPLRYDGASCGAISFPTDVVLTKDDNRPSYAVGQVQTYKIVVKNDGPAGVFSTAVQDTVPAGIPDNNMTWTAATYGTAVSRYSSGTGDLNDTIDLAMGDSVVYTAKIAIPNGYTGNLLNTAEAKLINHYAEASVINNTITDTDSVNTTTTEVCNNGFDDDGDGFVDCFDGDCAGVEVCTTTITGGTIPNCPDTPDVVLFSMREQFRRTNVVSEGYCTPMVGDLDGDGIPEIVAHTINKINGAAWTNGSNATIRTLNGQTGGILNSVTVPRIHYFSHSTSLADVDNDGDGEVYVVSGDQRLRGFDHNLVALPGFATNVIGQGGQNIWDNQKAAGVQFADFDQDGQTELLVGIQVFNALTGAIVAEPPTKANANNWSKGQPLSGDYIPSVADVLPDNFCATCSGPEIIAGNTVYAIDLSNPTANAALTIAAQMLPLATYGDGFTSIADWDGDDSLDVIVTSYTGGGSQIYIWNPRTQALIAQDQLGSAMPAGLTSVLAGHQAGRTSVADFDGDGTNELAIVTRHKLILFESDLSVKWERVTNDGSRITSATAFDFEGDGNVEVVYRDEDFLRIMDGVTGTTKDSLSCTSGTRVDMPVIADVDADGQAEIIVACGNDIVVYEADLTPWMPTRKVWNNFSYSPAWVNDDLTIPAHRQNKALIPGLDIYAAQAPITDPSGNIIYPALPDFVVSIDSSTVVNCNDDSTTVFVSICNDDAAALIYGYPLSFYDGDPTSGGTLLGTRLVTIGASTITSDSCYQFTFNAPNQPTDLYVVVNDDGTGNAGYPTTVIEECDSSNNVINGDVGCAIDGGVSKTDGQLNYIPGGAAVYTITARNNGPNFTGGIVSDPLPAGVGAGDVSWTAQTFGGATTTAVGTMNGALQDTVDITGGDSVVYTVTIATPASLTGNLVNTVTITVPGDTITTNNTATDIDTVDCTFAISGQVNSRTAAWQEIGTVVSGFTYNFSSSGGAKTFTATNGPANGQVVNSIIYNTGTGDHASLSRDRYHSNNLWFNTITGYDNSPPGWTGLSGVPPENAPVLGFMAFVDQNGNGVYDSGSEEFIRDINSLSINPTTTGQLYMVFYDNGPYGDNSGILTLNASITASSVNLGVDSTICAGDSVFLDAGNPNALSWVWSTGATTQTIQGKANGEHSVVVTTVGGCTTVDTMNITLDSVIVNLGNDTTVCTDSVVVLDAGNPGATSWIWNNAITTQLDTVNSAGNYKVVVTNGNGCSDSDSVTVSVFIPVNPQLGNDTSICTDSSLTITATGGNSWLWTDGGTNQDTTVNSAGTYDVTLIDANGCPNFDTIVVSMYPQTSFSLGNDTSICEDSTITFDPGVGTSWVWNNGETSQDITVDSASSYIVVVTDGNGCVTTDTINLSIGAIAGAGLGNDTAICAGDTITLDAGAAAGWSWNVGGNQQTLEVFTADSFIVTVTNAQGCSANDTIVVSLNSLPVVSLGGNTSICTDSSLTLDAINGTSWLWTDGGTNRDTTINTAGTYDVRVTDGNGCINRDTITVSMFTPLVYDLGNDTSLCPDSSITINIGVGTGWVWNVPGGGSSITIDSTGEYIVRVSDANGCESLDTINVSVGQLSTGGLGNDTTICSGDSLVLDAGTGTSHLWNTTAISQTITVNSADTFSVAVGNAQGCSILDTIIVSVTNRPTIELGSDTTICLDSTLTLTVTDGTDWEWSNGSIANTLNVSTSGEVSVIARNGGVCPSYDTIQVGHSPLSPVDLGSDTTICTGDSIQLDAGTGLAWNWLGDGSGVDSTLMVNQTGTYIAVVDFPFGCTNNDTIDVTVTPLPEVVLGSDTSICSEDSLLLDAENTGSSYLWQDGSIQQTLQTNVVGKYWVTVTTNAGCMSTDTIEIDTLESPSINILPEDTVFICDVLGETALLQLENIDGLTVNWNTGESGQSITVKDTGKYYAVKINEFLCSAADTIYVDRFCEIPTFTMPNVFTPTNDGTNENAVPLEDPDDLISLITFIDFAVYNRWGVMMHLQEGTFPKWDGNFMANGKECPSGTYFWIVHYEDLNGKRYVLNGFIQLMR